MYELLKPSRLSCTAISFSIPETFPLAAQQSSFNLKSEKAAPHP
jgi:hypothetical protein